MIHRNIFLGLLSIFCSFAAVVQAQPTMTSLVVAADNSSATLTFSEGVYTDVGSIGDLVNADLTVTITGGTATLSSFSVVHTAGDATATISLTLSGTPDGSELLTVQPADGASIYNSSDQPMSASESASDNLNDEAPPVFVSAKTTTTTNIAVTFNEPVQNPDYTKFTGNPTVTAAAIDAIDNTVVNLTINAVAPDYTTNNLDIGSAAVEDLAGNSNSTDNNNSVADGISPSFVDGNVTNANPDQLVVNFDESMSITDGSGFTVGGTSNGTITAASASGSSITFTIAGTVVSGENITLSYDGSGNATDAAGNPLNSFLNQAITNNVGPKIVSAVVQDAAPNQLVATFDDAITLSDASGFSISGTSGSISSVSGSGSNMLTFTLSQNVLYGETLLFSYDGSGDAQNSVNIDLNTFSNFNVTNNVNPLPEPTNHVTNFTATASSTTVIDLSWLEVAGGQEPDGYLIVGRDALTGTFATVTDGTPVADDNNWADGNYAINLTAGTTSQTVNNLTSGRNYVFRIYPYTNSGAVIDYKTSAPVPEDNATLPVGSSTSIQNGSGTASYSSIVNTRADAQAQAANFTFDILDDGSNSNVDTAPTLISQMVINRAAADNTGDWTNVIAGVIFSDGTNSINSQDNPGDFVIAANSITISNIPSSSGSLGYIADNATKTYEIRVWLRTDIVSTGLDIDNKNLVFSISDGDITLAAGPPNSSQFTGSFTSSGNSNNTVTVTATRLYWQSVSGISYPHANFTVTVQATDANLNRDFDRTGNVSMTAVSAPSGGYLESDGFPNDTDENLVNGAFTRTDMQVHKAGTYTFRASLSGLTSDDTGPHTFVSGDAQSDIVITAFDPPDNIPYQNYQEATVNGDGVGDIKVAEFTIRDGGAGSDPDNAATVLEDITFSLSNFANIRNIGLHDGTSVIANQPAAASVTFTGLNLEAPDDGSKTFSLYVSFNSTVTDNQNFQFIITSATASGSTFTAPDAGGAASPLAGDDNRIEVTSDRLAFVTQPSNVTLSATMTPAVTLEAIDANNNRDLDNNATVSLSSSGTMTGDPLAVPLINGIGMAPAIVHTAKGTNLTLTASLAGHTNAVSTPFEVFVSVESTLEATAFTPAANIRYINYQESDIVLDGIGEIQVGEFIVKDGGADLSDPDTAPTTITSLEVSISNFDNIRRIALYSDTTELAELPGAATVVFNGLNFVTPDNTSATLKLYVSYNSLVDDNEQSVFTITNVTTDSQSSDFASFAAATPATGDLNRIEVVATQLTFTTQPPATAFVLANVSPAPVVAAVDAFGNTDLDYSSPINVGNSKGLGMSNVPTNITNGIVAFPVNFQYTDVGDGSAGNGTLGISATDPNADGVPPNVAVSNGVTVRVAQTTLITAGSLSEPATISSLNTAAPGIAVFDFVIEDDGGAEDDGIATVFTDILLTPGATYNNAAFNDWTQIIAGATLTDDMGNTASGLITPTDIRFKSLSTDPDSIGYVGDNASKTYTLNIWLYDSLDFRVSGFTFPMTGYTEPTVLVDNKKLEFTAEQMYFNVATNSSQIGASESVSSGDALAIDVDATSLDFTLEPPTIAYINTPYQVRAEARDAAANRDVDFTFNLSSDVTNQGGLTMLNAPTTADSFAAGKLDFDAAFQYRDAGASPAGQLQIQANGLTGNTGAIEVLVSAESYVVADNAGLNNTIVPVQYDANDIVNDGVADVEIARFILYDGTSPTFGSVPDADGAETRITDLDIAITNSTNLKKVALYIEEPVGSGTFVEVVEVNAAPVINFEDLTNGLFFAADDDKRVFTIVASFQDTYTEGDVIQVTIDNIETRLGGSLMDGAMPLPFTDPAKNKLDIVATALVFQATPLDPIQGIEIAPTPVVPTVQAEDSKGNLDISFNNSATVTSGAGMANVPTAFVGGVLNFPGFYYTSPGNGTLTIVAGALNATSTPIDVIHTELTTLDIGGVTPETNNGIEPGNFLPASGVNKAILGFDITAVTGTAAQPVLQNLTVNMGNPYATTLSNIRLVSSADSKYDQDTDLPLSATLVTNPTSVEFQNINLDLSTGTKYLFVVVDIQSTASLADPAINPTIAATPALPQDVDLSSGTVRASLVGRVYGFRDEIPPTVYDDPGTTELDGLTPRNGDPNFPTSYLISLRFNERVLPADSTLSIYSLTADTLVAVLKIDPLASTDSVTFYYDPGAPIAGSTLQDDTDYYILIAANSFSDLSGNTFAGITGKNDWVFKTSDNVPPVFPTGLAPNVVNIIDVGFDLQVALDEPGRIYYIVVDPNVDSGTPTVTEIRNRTFGTILAADSADIISGNAYHYFSIFDPAVFAAGNDFRVWITAQDNALPTPNAMAEGTQVAVDGTLVSTGSGIQIQNTPGGTPSDICLGEPQTVLAPINLVEGANNDFVSGSGQTINLVLPSGFEFDTTTAEVIVQGGNISNPGYDFLNQTILTVSYDISGTNQRDKLIIKNLKVKALGSAGTSGDIIRLGGTGALSIADGTVLASLNTTQRPIVTFSTDPNTSSIGDAVGSVALIPDLSVLDKGTREFFGNGVFGDTLYTQVAGVGTHTITFKYTDEQGCVSEYSLTRNIFDSDNAIVGLNNQYCSLDTAIISSTGRTNFTLIQLTVDVPPDQPPGVDTVNTFGVDEDQSLFLVGSNYVFTPTTFHIQHNFDKFFNSANQTNNGGLIGELLFTGIYQSNLNITEFDTLKQRVSIYFTPTAEITIANYGSIGDNSFDTLNILPATQAPAELEFCVNEAPIELKGSTSNGYFAVTIPTQFSTDSIGYPGLVDNGDGTGFIDLAQMAAASGYGEVQIKFIANQDGSLCNTSVAQTIRIHPAPIADYGVPAVICEDTPIAFADISGYSASDSAIVSASANNAILPAIVDWAWNFDDDANATSSNPNTATGKDTVHTYQDPDLYNVTLQVASEFGCQADTSRQLVVGGIPQPSFVFTGLSLRDSIAFQSTSTVEPSSASLAHTIDVVQWDIDGNGSFDLIDDDQDSTADNNNILKYRYANPGVYDVRFVAVSSTGCSDSLTRQIAILDNKVAGSTADSIYNETFNTDDGNWLALAEIDANGQPKGNSSWAWGTPSGKSIAAGSDQQPGVWITGLTMPYDSAERSYVYSPVIDFSSLNRPMIQFDIFIDLEEQDGVIFEYSTDSLNIMDPNKKWQSLGKQNEGINWFNAVGLAGTPGVDPTGLGWTGTNTGWITAKHDLGEIYKTASDADEAKKIKSNVVFRFGLGSIPAAKNTGGFAFDNVFMGNRTRTVLIEHFSSMAGSPDNKTENQAIRDLANQPTGAELVVINYHTSADGPDYFNQINPAEPDARALYYGIDATPRAVIDGSQNGNENKPFSAWGETYYSQRTLQISPFEINITTPDLGDGKLHLNATVTALSNEINNDITIHVAIVADSLPASEIPFNGIASGEESFYSTLLKMLPDAVGTQVVGGLPLGQTVNVESTWDPVDILNNGSLDPNNLRVVVFVQDNLSKKVHQAQWITPAINLILAVEELEDGNRIALYPNPADSRLFVSTTQPLGRAADVLILDVTGKVIQRQQLPAGGQRFEIATSDFTPGIYYLVMQTHTGSTTFRFVVQH